MLPMYIYICSHCHTVESPRNASQVHLESYPEYFFILPDGMDLHLHLEQPAWGAYAQMYAPRSMQLRACSQPDPHIQLACQESTGSPVPQERYIEGSAAMLTHIQRRVHK